MSFRFLLYLVLLAPFVVLGAFNHLSLERVIRHHEESLVAERQAWTQATNREIQELYDRMDKATISLSRPTEIVNAVQATDNDILSDWGASFIGDINSVLFADADGLVLARAPDEFRFGDALGSETYIRDSLANGLDLTFALVDGRQSAVFCRTIRKYNDVPVGVVCVVVQVTPAMLARIVPSTSMFLSLVGPDGQGISGKNQGSVLYRTRVNAPKDGYNFELSFVESESYRQLVSLKHSLYVNGTLAVVGTLIALVFFVRRRFAPYTSLVNGIVDYSADRLGLDALRERMESLRRKPTSEIARIASALIGMIDVTKENLQRNEELNAHLRNLASKDSLTQLHNRRALDEALAHETKRSQRYLSPLCAVMIDIDHFKGINDSFGHSVGDEVLRDFAATIARNSRSTDIVGRWGGEEFLILCPGIPLAAAQIVAEKLRRQITHTEFAKGLRVTASAGVAEYVMDEPVEELIARADRALYKAKTTGRNRVEPQAA